MEKVVLDEDTIFFRDLMKEGVHWIAPDSYVLQRLWFRKNGKPVKNVERRHKAVERLARMTVSRIYNQVG